MPRRPLVDQLKQAKAEEKVELDVLKGVAIDHRLTFDHPLTTHQHHHTPSNTALEDATQDLINPNPKKASGKKPKNPAVDVLDNAGDEGMQDVLKSMPKPPFGKSQIQDPFDVPKDPKKRKEKMHKLLNEATSHWSRAREEGPDQGPDPVQMYLEDLIKRGSKYFEKGNSEEGLKMLHKG